MENTVKVYRKELLIQIIFDLKNEKSLQAMPFISLMLNIIVLYVMILTFKVNQDLKQYLYYLSYQEILAKYNVKEVKNYFLMPKRASDPAITGFVKLDMLKQFGLGVIEVRMLSPDVLYDNYLKEQHINLSELK